MLASQSCGVATNPTVRLATLSLPLLNLANHDGFLHTKGSTGARALINRLQPYDSMRESMDRGLLTPFPEIGRT